MKSADVHRWVIKEYVCCEVDRLDSLLGEFQWLLDFPKNVAAQEALILDWLDRYGGQAGTPPPSPAFAPAPRRATDEGKTLSD